jgi:hypothetical protein
MEWLTACFIRQATATGASHIALNNLSKTVIAIGVLTILSPHSLWKMLTMVSTIKAG